MKFLMLVFKILLFLFFAAVTAFTFETEQAVGIILLVSLVMAQLWFLSKRIKRTTSTADITANTARTASVIKGLADQSKKRRQQIISQAAAATAATATPPAPTRKPRAPRKMVTPVAVEETQPIDPSLFSKFQQSLDQTDDDPFETDEAADVVVNLSKTAPKATAKAAAQPPIKPVAATKEPTGAGPVKPKMRNPYAGAALPPTIKTNGPTLKTAAPTTQMNTPTLKPTPSKETQDNHLMDQVPAEPLGDLFDHIDEVASAKEAAKPVTPKPRRPQQDTQSGYSPLESNETLDLQGFDDLEAPEGQIASLQLKAAEKAVREGQHPKAAEIATEWLKGEGKGNKDLSETLPFIELASKALWQTKDYRGHLKLWESVFGSFVPKNSKEYLPLLEERIDEYVKVDLEEQAVPFLLTALSVYKAQEDHLRMEGVYISLEKAYTRLKDDKALAQCLNGHLGVKRKLKDYPGQLELLDELGKRLYDQGNQKASRQCYEESLVVKQQMAATQS